MEEKLNANAQSIKKLDKEMEEISEKINKSKEKEANETNGGENDDAKVESKRCRYFNRGHCKFKNSCKFKHHKEICTIYLECGSCNDNSCMRRHPKQCKWWQRGECKRQDCNYLHVTFASEDGRSQAHENFPCSGCKNIFEDRSCVVKHETENITYLLCLNCDDWIQYKQNIFNPGWTMFDNNGGLRSDI